MRSILYINDSDIERGTVGKKREGKLNLYLLFYISSEKSVALF